MASGKTLYEVDEKKPLGFFPKLYETLVTSLTEEDSNHMKDIKDDPKELIRFIYGMKKFKTSLSIMEAYPEKNPYEAKIKRDYGNKAYQEKKDIEALFLYTQAVIASPCGENGKGRELSLALANRSAVLFSLKAYALALDDIKLALESGYPGELKFKLLERRGKILAFFTQHYDARNTYRELLQSLDVAKLEPTKRLKMQKEAQKILEFYNKAKSVYNDPNVKFKPDKDLPKVHDKNPKYPAIANCLNFKHENGRGRFAVASRDIEVGEFICVENPLVSRILPEYSGSNCENCFKAMKSPLPCPVCSKVMFCSYECRKVALDTFHPYECKLIDFLEASGMSIICFLAYRAITKKSLSFFLDNRDKFKTHDETAGSVKSQVTKHLSNDYRNLYNLVTHHSERKIGDIFHRGMFSVMLLRCLKKMGYFGEERKDISDPDQDDLTEDECYIGSLLNHFLEVLQFNSHEVAQFEMITKNKEEGATSNFIGAAIYPTLAMFNHSCDPSIVRFYVEDVVCVQAIKNIKKGEEICENYGPIFFHSNREDRQERLKKQYWFDCNCVPCQEDWPLMHEMTDEELNFRCKDCNGSVKFKTSSTNPLLRCVCGTPVPMLQALKKISETEMISAKAKQAMDSGDLASAQDLYCDYLMTLDRYLVPPYPDYYKIQQSIWKCIWMRFGNRVVRSKVKKPMALQDDDTVD